MPQGPPGRAPRLSGGPAGAAGAPARRALNHCATREALNLLMLHNINGLPKSQLAGGILAKTSLMLNKLDMKLFKSLKTSIISTAILSGLGFSPPKEVTCLQPFVYFLTKSSHSILGCIEKYSKYDERQVQFLLKTNRTSGSEHDIISCAQRCWRGLCWGNYTKQSSSTHNRTFVKGLIL